MATDAGFDFFFYGTLMDADVRAAVAGAPLSMEPAVLPDHRVVPVGRGMFPMIEAARGATAAGVLCRDVAVAVAARFSLFENEGHEYRARRVAVRAGGDGDALRRPAWVYLPTAALKRGPGRWDFAVWQKFAKRPFLIETRRTMRAPDGARLAPHIEAWRLRAGT